VLRYATIDDYSTGVSSTIEIGQDYRRHSEKAQGKPGGAGVDTGRASGGSNSISAEAVLKTDAVLETSHRGLNIMQYTWAILLKYNRSGAIQYRKELSQSRSTQSATEIKKEFQYILGTPQLIPLIIFLS